MPKRTRSFRTQLLKDLADPKEAARYANAALDDSAEMFLVALRDVAEARQMSAVAADAGVSRESIYRMLSKAGNPTHNTLRGILKALCLKLSIEPMSVESEPVRSGSRRRISSLASTSRQTARAVAASSVGVSHTMANYGELSGSRSQGSLLITGGAGNVGEAVALYLRCTRHGRPEEAVYGVGAVGKLSGLRQYPTGVPALASALNLSAR